MFLTHSVLQVTLHDGRDADGNADDFVDVTTSIEVQLIDVEELGVVMLSAEEPAIGTAVRATLEDGDGSIQGVSWQWARSENGRTGWVNISGATSSSYTTLRSDAGSFLRASVTTTRTDRGGGKTAEAVTADRVFAENEPRHLPVHRRRPAHRAGEYATRREHRHARGRLGPGG